MKTLEDIGLSVNEQSLLENVVRKFRQNSDRIYEVSTATAEELRVAIAIYNDELLPLFNSTFLKKTMEFNECREIFEKAVSQQQYNHLRTVRVYKILTK